MTVDKSAARVRRMFGEIAGRYDLLNHLLSLNVDRYWRWRTVREVAPAGEAPILDLCTGTGDLALAYAKAAGGAKIVGADFCHPMLKLGDEKKRSAGLNGQLTFVEADAEQLPFPADRFQIVCVAFGLRNVSRTERGLAEMARVCRPGGQVAVLEFSTPQWQPFKAFYGWYFRNVLPRIGQLLASNRLDAYNYLPESVGEFPAGEALAQLMRQAGLEQVRYRSLTLGIATLYVGTKCTPST
jgi:demethylmenaquinone methyltransferase/2-methoxy-6-polyprenyl-1,4-benzoquinol methylase